MTLVLTPDELRNGWTPETLTAYRAERDREDGRQPYNIVTAFERPKALPTIQSAAKFNPHNWGKRA